MPDDPQKLKDVGFICIRITPTMWRVRGQDDPWPADPRYVNLFPFARKFKHQYGQVESYTDALAVARQYLIPYPIPSPAQAAAIREWRDGLDAFIARYPHTMVA